MAIDEPLPTGYVYVTARTTYLQMFRPDDPTEALPAEVDRALADVAPVRWSNPPLDEYRELFHAVGGPWGWTGRLLMTDDELRATLSDPAIEVWRILAGGEVAGFIELDTREAGDVEIVYFGFLPEWTGRGLGGKVLRWAATHTWDMPDRRRLWLHTCDFDHPKAPAVYERAGFRVYAEHTGPEAYPAEHVARLAREAAQPNKR